MQQHSPASPRAGGGTQGGAIGGALAGALARAPGGALAGPGRSNSDLGSVLPRDVSGASTVVRGGAGPEGGGGGSRGEAVDTEDSEAAEPIKGLWRIKLQFIFIWLAFSIVLGFSIGIVNIAFHKVYHSIEEWWWDFSNIPGGNSLSMHLIRAGGVIASAAACAWLVARYFPECAGGIFVSFQNLKGKVLQHRNSSSDEFLSEQRKHCDLLY